MRDLSPHAFDRTSRGRPNRSTIRLLCPKTQRTPAWQSCWFRHLTWCQRRRPRRRPREPERVLDARWSRTHRPMTPRRTPPMKTRRRKERSLPQQGEKRKGRPPQLGRPEGPRKGGPSLRTTPPMPMTAKRSGRSGPSRWQNHKYSNT